MSETSAPAALMRTIEKLEAERTELEEEAVVAQENEAATKTMRNLTIGQVRTFLRNMSVEDMTADVWLNWSSA